AALPVHALAHELPGAADGFCTLAGAALTGLLVVTAELHLAEDPLALHLLLQDAQRLIDVVFADENLHFDRFLPSWVPRKSFQGRNLRGGGGVSTPDGLERGVGPPPGPFIPCDAPANSA